MYVLNMYVRVCMYVMHACTYVCVYVCVYVRMYDVCMLRFIEKPVCMYVHNTLHKF